MNKPYLLPVDFDGTLVKTKENSPNGMNVGVACGRTIHDIFGPEGYRVYTDKLGGLQNREPGELMGLMLSEMGISVSVKEAAELFVAQKLRHLIPEISPEWPKFYPGVVEFFSDVQHGRYPLEVAIVSSGHNEFINRVFEVNGIDAPLNMVTSDDIRGRSQPDRPLYKPNPYQLAVVHRRWKGKSEGLMHSRYVDLDHGKSMMAYVGDDPVKDGVLAERSRIPFIHMNPDGQDFVPNADRGQIGIHDFNDLRSLLDKSGNMMAEGRDFSEVLVGRKRSEIFPTREGQMGMHGQPTLGHYARR